MASVQIIDETKTGLGTYITAACEKMTADVSYIPTFGNSAVRVCVQNASNRAYRMGVGKAFPSFDAAVAAYKSADVRAIIRAAADLCATAGRAAT